MPDKRLYWRGPASFPRPNAVAAAAALIVVTTVLLASIASAYADDYFKGKTIHIIVGTPPGGGYDTYARLIARHLGDAIAGKPTIIVSNMPGASGTKAASYLYSIAPKDGSVIATFNKSMPLYQALGQSGNAFKTEQMSWIGNVSQTADIVAVWHTTGVKTIADAKRRAVIMGADSSGTMTAYPALLNAMLGTRFKIVTGYAGGPAVDHAMEQGEVEGRGSNPWTSWKATRPGWVKEGLITPLVQVGLRKEPDLPDVPLLTDLAETDEQRAMFRFISAPASIERPFAGPPGMAIEPLDILRRAFDRIVRDPAFLAEAAQLNLDVDPHSGEDVTEIVADIVATPPAIVRKVRDITAARDSDGKSKAQEQPD
jgi:tripartite-type tricarboxylate transporter receptor subunit TctC